MKRVNITLAAALVALVSVIVWQELQPPEPVYQGKRLSGWMKARVTSGFTAEAQKQARAAVRQAGTNAIPTLLRMLRATDSGLKLKLMDLAQKQHIIKLQFTHAEDWNNAAVLGFSALGTNAQNAVTALIEIGNQDIAQITQLHAIFALGCLGPSAEEAVPSLLCWTTNADHGVRSVAIAVLGEIHAAPDRVVPVLISALHDQDFGVRVNALETLGQFGPDAKIAVPALVEVFNGPDAQVRGLANAALQKIDPVAAAKAGAN